HTLSVVHSQPHAELHLEIAHRSNSCGGYVEPERGSELSVVQLGFRFLFKAQPEYGRTAALADFANRNCRVGARVVWVGSAVVTQSWASGRSGVADRLSRIRRIARRVLVRSADAACESEWNDAGDAVRIRGRALYLVVDARALDLVRDDWDGGDVCSRVFSKLDFPFPG